MKNLISLFDYSSKEIREILEISRLLKLEYKAGKREWDLLKGKKILLYFEKPSTRTRVSFEVAAKELGAFTIYMSKQDSQISRGEPIKDTVRVLERYVDAIVARVRNHDTLLEMVKYANIPIINALSDKCHPTQALADMLTIWEYFDTFKVNIAFLGDGKDNVLQSLLIAAASLGANVILATKEGYEPYEEVLLESLNRAKKTGSKIFIERDPCKAVRDADVIYTDVWVSMGFEDEYEKRIKDLKEYQLNTQLLKCNKREAIIMHCLPAFRGQEITEEVLESERSVVWDQAENKLHVARAVLSYILR